MAKRRTITEMVERVETLTNRLLRVSRALDLVRKELKRKRGLQRFQIDPRIEEFARDMGIELESLPLLEEPQKRILPKDFSPVDPRMTAKTPLQETIDTAKGRCSKHHFDSVASGVRCNRKGPYCKR